MEILSPAGSMDQAIAAISAGCDALYGGLKQWSARNRAINFTIDEYNRLLSLCHEKKVRFYLTINILLRNDEVENVFELLDSGHILLPDAIIAADIGFIISLRERYSNLPIHASTQFGAASLADIRFLEMIGVKRVILARELLLPEIEHICKNTSMEVEVFAYGSQCVALSGQCLWGGLLSDASGNRGRCIGMCRDLYSCNNEMGQFLYPQDINAVGILDQLEKLGVHSVKIEGRMRSKSEISSVISDFKSHTVKSEEKFYTGFLSCTTPVSGMFHAVNPRIKYSEINVETTENDLLIDDTNRYVFGNDSRGGKFVKNVSTRPLSIDQINLSIKIFVSKQKLIKIDYINTHGERKLFFLIDTPDKCIYIKELRNKISQELIGNLYEFSTDVPDNTAVYFSESELKKIIDEINDSCANIEKQESDYLPSCECDFSVITGCADRIEYYKQFGADKIIYNIVSLGDLKKALSLSREIDNVYFRLPLIDFNGYMSDILPLLHRKCVVLTKVSQVQYIEKYDFRDVIADYTMNLWNTYALYYLKKSGIVQFIYHPELSYEYNRTLSQSTGMKGYVISYGKIPVGYSRGCFGECGLCNCAESSSLTLNNISKGYDVQIICNKKAGYRSIISSKAFSCAKKPDKDVGKIFVESTPYSVNDEDTFKIYSRSVK